ncbi:MAG: hypothetical protein IJ179_09950 [Oscillospiraceae bacterium]|nr:hypothetical protein [Oscillospiraceae bacterium]
MSIDEAIEMTQTYLDKLEWIHPIINSQKFLDNSYAKVACRRIIRELIESKDIPFNVTPLEVLQNFSDKMKRYACDMKNKELSFAFIQAAETAEYLIEEVWLDNWQWKKPRDRRQNPSRKGV